MTFIYDPPTGPIEVLYQDANLVVVNKPAGLLSVPGRADDHKECVQSRLSVAIRDVLVVHRLDMDTSGVMVFAFDKDTHRHLSKQFESKTVSKTYICLVGGQVSEDQGEVDLPLRCDWPNRPLQMVDFDLGKPSKTLWQVLARKADQTRLELTPITGRSHQLRVHCKEMGHPILGDRFYASKDLVAKSPRLCLHAHVLEFDHPETNERLSLKAPCEF